MKPNKHDLNHYVAMAATGKGKAAPLSSADIAKLDEKHLCEKFAEVTANAHGAFRTCGKLRYALEEKTGPDAIYAKLAAYGIDATDVSNAGPACHVFRHLVKPGHVTEAAFDQLPYRTCCAITRVLGLTEKAKTAKKLSPDEVAEVLKGFPKNAEKNLVCIADHGMTLAEWEKAAEAEAKKAAATPAAGVSDPGKSASAPASYTKPQEQRNAENAAEDGEDGDDPIEEGTDGHAQDRVTKAPKTTAFQRASAALDTLEKEILDLSSEPNAVANAKALLERLATSGQILAEWLASQEQPAFTGTRETVPPTNGKVKKDKAALAA